MTLVYVMCIQMAQYWFGTDSNGKSLFDSVWFGARNSILIAVIATFINVVIGLACGCCLGDF